MLVKNLSYKVNEDDLQQFMTENFGETKKIVLQMDDNGRSKGFAFVEFFSEVRLTELCLIGVDEQSHWEKRV